jgi:hypothetical protein
MHGCMSTFACHTHTHKHTPFILTLKLAHTTTTPHKQTLQTPPPHPPYNPPHLPTAIARFMYECDIQFVHADHPAFKRMIKAVAQAGPAFQPPDAEVFMCGVCVCVCVQYYVAYTESASRTHQQALTGSPYESQRPIDTHIHTRTRQIQQLLTGDFRSRYTHTHTHTHIHTQIHTHSKYSSC